MKKWMLLMTAALAMIVSVNANAQTKNRFGDGPDSTNCKLYLDYYQNYYKQNNFDAAFPNWRKALQYCPPTASQNMVGAHGSKLLTRQISKSYKDKEAMKGLVDTLLLLQDLKVQYFPKLKTSALNAKGQYMVKYCGKDKEYLNKELLAIMDDLEEKTHTQILFNALESSIDLFKSGSKDAEEVLGIYEKVMDCIENAPAKDSAARAENNKAKSDMEAIFAQSNVASCDDIIRIFSPKLEEDPDNISLAGNVVKLMNATDGCFTNDLYLRAVTTLHKNAPSAKTAFGLYRLNSVNGDSEKAIAYLEEAISLTEDDAQAAEYNYELAVYALQNGSKSKAYAAANKAAALGNGYAGKAYMVMGNIWKGTSCGGNEITARAHYWAAADFYSKAAEADPSLAEEARRQAGSCSAYYPAVADAFMYGISNGQSYTVSCGGMSKTTTVRLVNR